MEPKHCPFCGGNTDVVYFATKSPKPWWEIHCEDDRCIAYHILKKYKTKEAAIEDWNRRA